MTRYEEIQTEVSTNHRISRQLRPTIQEAIQQYVVDACSIH